MSKKRIIIISILGALILAVGILTAGIASRRGDYIPPRPEDTALEYWICDDVADVDWTGHEQYPGFGVWTYLGEGYLPDRQGEWPPARVIYSVTAWPDYSDGGSFVTRIVITDPAVSVYGLTVNSDLLEFRRVMESMGYEVETVNESAIRATRGPFTFSFGAGERLTVLAQVANRRGLVF